MKKFCKQNKVHGIIICQDPQQPANPKFKKINIDINPSDKSDMIVVSQPIRDSEITSPLRISGRARGLWFFEGSFPIVLMDKYRNVIAEGHATAQGEWQTHDFVTFVGNLRFNNI